MDYDASFSADGNWIIFTSERDSDGSGQADLYRVHPDGTGLERLRMRPPWRTRSALSGWQKLAYVSTQGGARTANIWVMDVATKRTRNLTGMVARISRSP